MKTFSPDKIRNVGLVGHSGAGKTSVAEAMLYDSGSINRLGKVDDGTSVMDYDPEEIKRNISISSSMASCEWEDHKINIIDTPGDQNFVPDALACMEVMDSVIVVLPGDSGIQVQAEKVWNWAREKQLPRIIFINKMDSERASYPDTVENIKNVFQQKILRLTLPIETGPEFKGVVDLLYMKAYIYQKDGEGKFTEEDIPAELQDLAESERQELIESVAETDEALLDKFMENGALDDEDLFAGFRKAVISGEVSIVVCGSATLNIVIRKTLDLLTKFMPSPMDTGSRNTEDGEVAPIEKGEANAFVFKTVADPYAGKLSVLRVYSGLFSSDSNVHNISGNKKEHLGSLLALQGKKQTQISNAVVGDIVAVAKLKNTNTGDTLSGDKTASPFLKAELPQPVISFAVEPKSKGDEEKVASSLTRLTEEDLTLRVKLDKQTKELIVSGMGQVHIEVVMNKLKDKFGVEMTVKPPRIAYKETIRGKSKGHGRLKKQSGGRGQFADCHIELEPGNGQNFEFVDAIVGGVIPRQYIPGVEKGIVEVMEHGVVAGYPVTNCKVTLVDGKFHDVDSSELAFKIAGSMAFKEAFMAAKPVLLEPVMLVSIESPEECVGDIMGDLNQRRGRVLGIDTSSAKQKVNAHVPMSEVLRYAPDLRSITGGRGSFSMEFFSYEEAPQNVIEKVIEDSKEMKEERAD